MSIKSIRERRYTINMTHEEAFNVLKTGASCVITGPAGSGKTYLLNRYVEYLKKHSVPVAITASTGIASTHLGGQTIHSWSGIGIQEDLTEYDLEGLEEKSQLRRRLTEAVVLVIDEISMLHDFQLDLVDKVLKFFRKNAKPFGGLQVILCGDFFQLPPVGRGSGYEGPRFAYHARVWNQVGFEICYLETQYRQEDGKFLEILSAIREARVTEEIREILRSRQNATLSLDIEPTRLHTHNIHVDGINSKELEGLSGKSVKFSMTTKGRKNLVEQLIKNCLAPFDLELKIGARVMCVKNNFEVGFVNGSLGIIESLDESGPTVRLVGGKRIVMEPMSWAIEEDGKTKAEIIQFPLRLAWAITVHKSQGMSLDAVEADLSQAFEQGMGYVALSRVRTLEGLVLRGFNETALQVNDEALRADKRLRELSEDSLESFKKDEAGAKRRADDFIEVHGGKIVEKVSTYDATKKLLEEKYSLAEIAKERGFTKETALAHIEKISEEDMDCDISYLRKEVSPTKLKKINQALEELDTGKGEILLSPVKNKVGANVSFNDIRLGRILYKRSKL